MQHKTRLITFITRSTFVFSVINYSFLFLLCTSIENRIIAAAALSSAYMFWAGNTGDTASTDWQHFRVRYCSFILRVLLAVCHCSILPQLWLYLRYFRLCTFILPELKSISGFDTAGAADTRSSLGGYFQYWQYPGVMYCRYIIAIMGSSLLFGRFWYSLIVRVLAALKYTSILRNSTWRLLRWASVHIAVCRLAIVALSSRCKEEAIIR